MRFGRIGAALVVVGSVSGILAWAMGFTGTDVRWGVACWQWAGCGNVAGGGLSVAQWIAPIALTSLGIGCALLGLAGPDPLVGRVTRIAVATLAVGLVSYVVANHLPVRAGSNTLENPPVIAGLVVGLLGTIFGLLLTGLSLLRAQGPVRVAGSMLLAGPLLLLLGQILSNASIGGLGGPFERALAAIGAISLFLSGIVVGMLAFKGDTGRALRGRTPR